MSLQDINVFIKMRLAGMVERPGMYAGTPEGVETMAWTLCEVFAVGAGIPFNNNVYLAFRKQDIPRCPGPMPVSQWYTDPMYGDPAIRDKAPTEHEASVEVVSHFIRLWMHLQYVAAMQESGST